VRRRGREIARTDDAFVADMAPFVIRAASETDVRALLAIYAPFVEHTAVSFETVVPSIEEFAARVRKCTAQWAWLVAEHDGRCLGYAYASMHRERAAYRWSAETSAYVESSAQRRGICKALYLALFDALIARGY